MSPVIPCDHNAAISFYVAEEVEVLVLSHARHLSKDCSDIEPRLDELRAILPDDREAFIEKCARLDWYDIYNAVVYGCVI